MTDIQEDIQQQIRELEAQAAERELVGGLAVEKSVRDRNRRLAHDLREQAFALRNDLPKVQVQMVESRQKRHA
jgi:hypothetical protein